MENNKKVVIITLNYNQNDYTLKCIDSLLKSDYKNYHILLIDNGSSEKNYSKLKMSLPADKRLFLKRIEKNRGYVGGVNLGMEMGVALDPDYFLIMNNDTIIDEKAITELVKTEEKYKQKAIVTGKVYFYGKPNMLFDIGYSFKNSRSLLYNRIGINETDRGQYDKESERDLLDDVYWLFPVKLYEEIGGYSLYFWHNFEQADFALRAKKKGYKLIYNPKPKLWHKGSVSFGGYDMNPVMTYYNTQSSLIFNYLHLNKWRFFLYMLEVLSQTLKISGKSSFLRLKKEDYLRDYSYAKRQGVLYFFRWLIKRNNNTGELPERLKKEKN